MSLDRDTFKLIFKIFFIGIIDALALWSSITLYINNSYKLLAILLIGVISINYVYLSKKAYPLRYILPGTIFMLMLIVYPLIYTVYVSFTNYGTGHILNKEQVVKQLEERYYLPDNYRTYNFKPFKNDRDEFIILFEDNNGNYLLGIDGKAEEIGAGDSRLKDTDGDGRIDNIDGYKLLKKKDIFTNLTRLQKLEFHFKENILKMKNFSSFAEYKKQYRYDADKDVLLDLQKDILYYPRKGYFTSAEGERLIPGFRTNVGWNNFVRLLTDERISGPFFRVFRWTLIWATLSVLTTFGLGLFMAILLNDKHLRFKTFYRIILILPYAIPAFISALVWHGLFDTEVGIINKMLEATIGSGIPWLIDPFWAKVALIIVNLWLGFPYMMIVALGALQSIPDSYYEAAAIDGASLWQQFRHITLPLLLVSMGPLIISSFAFNFNNFTVIYLFNKGRPAIVGAQTPAGATDILISYTYRLSFESGRGSDFGLASAVTILIFVITALITWFNFRYTGALEEVKENV